MKKLLVVVFSTMMLLFLASCGKSSEDGIIETFGNKVNSLDSYYIEADMVVNETNSTRSYSLNVTYKKEDLYKVSLTNDETSNEQIIIKNADGVHVLTPSLNKSFKFKSDWPFNGSHSYLPQSLIKDIANDENAEVKEEDGKIIIISSVEYEVDQSFKTQRVEINKDTMQVEKVIVLDDQNVEKMVLTINKFEENADVTDEDFNVNTTMAIKREETDSVIYEREITLPVYFPVGTNLEEENIRETGATITYGGEHSFTIIQEFVDDTSYVSSSSIIGEIVILKSGFGSLASNSISFIENGIEISVFSQTLSQEELVKIANSFIHGNEK